MLGWAFPGFITSAGFWHGSCFSFLSCSASIGLPWLFQEARKHSFFRRSLFWISPQPGFDEELHSPQVFLYFLCEAAACPLHFLSYLLPFLIASCPLPCPFYFLPFPLPVLSISFPPYFLSSLLPVLATSPVHFLSTPLTFLSTSYPPPPHLHSMHLKSCVAHVYLCV